MSRIVTSHKLLVAYYSGVTTLMNYPLEGHPYTQCTSAKQTTIFYLRTQSYSYTKMLIYLLSWCDQNSKTRNTECLEIIGVGSKTVTKNKRTCDSNQEKP